MTRPGSRSVSRTRAPWPLALSGAFAFAFALGACSSSPAPSGGTGGSNPATGGNGTPTGGGNGTGGSGNPTGGNATGGAGKTGGSGNPTGGGNPSGGNATGGAGKTGGAAGGATGTPCTPDTTNLVNAGGWVCDADTDIKVQGAWYGYGDGTSCTVPTNICSTGKCCIAGKTVVPDDNFTQWGCGLAVEFNSSGGDAPIKKAYAGPVKCWDLTLTGSSGKNVVRLAFTQSSDTAGKVSPFVEIPPFTNGYTGQICFTDAECADWAVKAGTCTKVVGTAGTPFDFQVQVSAGTDTASDFNVCVSKLAPAGGGSTGTGGTGGGTTATCTSPTGQGTISDRYGTAHVSCAGKDYIVQNNAWGSAAGQTITYGPGAKMKVTDQKGTGSNGAPASYPSIFTGANSGRSTAGSGLPKAVSALTAGTAKTSWTWAANGATGNYNASYDVWFSTSSAGDPSASAPSGGYLMVWYHKPTGAQPIGTSVATANIAGRNWSVWYGTNSGSGKPCVSYVAQQDVMSLSYSLGDFIQDAVTRKYLQSSWYLTNVFAGFEIWDGGVGLETVDFTVNP